MKRLFTRALLCALLTLGLHAAQSPSPQDPSARPSSTLSASARTAGPPEQAQGVPHLIRYGGTLRDAAGGPRAGTVALQFAIYRDSQGGAPLWVESQNVQLDAQGRYALILGATRELPQDIFAANEARWLGVRALADAEPEQPRVLLVSVPYALKAQDAETLGGRPASAYVLSASLGAVTDTGSPKDRNGGGQRAKSLDSGAVSTTGAHSLNAIPKFSATDTLADSLMFEQYTQPAFNAFGSSMGFDEDVVRVGDGTGLPKRLEIAGRMVADGFDVNTTAENSVHVVNSNDGGFALQVNAVSQSTGFTNGIFATAQSSQAIGLAGWVFEPLVPTVSGSQYTYGVWGQNENPTGAAVFASHVYDGAGGATAPTPTGAVGIYASTAHSSAIPGVFDQRAASGAILSARVGGTEVVGVNTDGDVTASGDITATGTITATGGFSGSGAGLTGITAADSTSLGGVAATSFARLDIANAFSMTQTINADLTLTGSINAGLRIVADGTSPNVVGGYSGNAYRSGAYGMTIGGGGKSGALNQAQDLFATVGGGENNVAGDSGASLANSGWATVGGGKSNNATGSGSTIGGGMFNTASGSGATVAGGSLNSASGTAATVPGGQSNSASGFASFAAGWEAHADHDRSFVWSDGTPFSSTATQQFMVRAQNGVQLLINGTGSVGGIKLESTSNSANMVFGYFGPNGGSNAVTAGVQGAAISGGGSNTGVNTVTDDYGHVGGGVGNRAGDNDATTTNNPYAIVGGGFGNAASGTASGVLGGLNNSAVGGYSILVGGSANSVGGTRAFLGGGDSNIANGNTSVVSGGQSNTAGGLYAAIGGGLNNTANGVAGTIAGGASNGANAEGATVGGGGGNQATGIYATVPGGSGGEASGHYSFAAGRQAKATHQGSFVWADSTAADMNSSAADEFTIRAGGGFRLFDSGNVQVFGISAAGAVTATSFTGDGSGLTGVSATVADGSITLANLAFDPATQVELDAHKSSSDHDASYVLKAGDTMAGTLNLPSNGLVAGTDQLVLVGGNVGIGTASPAGGHKLDVVGTMRAERLYGRSSGKLTLVGYDNGIGGGTGIEFNAVEQGFDFQTHFGGWGSRMVITDEGRVGIGTTSPAERLAVVGNGTFSGSVTAASFSGSGAALTGVAATDLVCAGCVAESEVAFDPATQTELDAHKTSSDHDARYARLAAANSFTAGLTAAGVIESTTGGFKFPDGTTQTSATSAGAVPNPMRVALLRWYEANTVGVNVAVGTTPIGIAFDGDNMWVANLASNNVTKIRASDGAVQGTFAVAGGPYGVAFDGSSIWVTNRNTNNITKVRPSDGAVLGTFGVGTGPQGVAFDGANLWVANRDTNNVTKIRASDGANLGTFAVGNAPQGIAFDGTHVWVVNEFDGTVMKVDSAGAVVGTFATGALSFGVAYDGANVWVTSTGAGTVKKLRASDGATQGTFALSGTPNGLAFDGANIWVALQGSTVKKLRASDGTVLGNFAIAGVGRDVAFDGANIWVTNQSVASVSKR